MEGGDLPSTSASTWTIKVASKESPKPSTSQKSLEEMDTSSPVKQLSRYSTDIVKNPLDGWTKEEKLQLYLGIRNTGSKNVKDIQERIPTKTTEQIIAAISHFKERAQRTPECESKKMKIRRNRNPKSTVPLGSWAKLLTDNLSFDELHTEMVSAMRLIAEFDDIPPAYLTEHIDFRQAYHQIADAMEGKALTNVEYISEMLNSCLFETALISKSFMSLTSLTSIVNSINLSEPATDFSRPTTSHEENFMRQLVSQKNYNPLGISHTLITPPNTRIEDPSK